jgi:CheY-like chemotaxis protein
MEAVQNAEEFWGVNLHFDVVAIEDNPGDARLIREALEEDERVKVRVAWNGTEGLALLEEGPPPNLILLDINLPGLSGLELVSRIRQMPELATVPIVMFSSSQLLEDVRDAETKGADMFVVKPFDVLEYLSVLRRIRRRLVDGETN